MREVELSEQVMIRLSTDLLERLRATSEANERTVSQTVRLAIKAYLSATPAERSRPNSNTLP